MDKAKQAISWLCLYSLASLWFLSASVFALFAVANENTIKDTLDKNDVYSKIVPAAIDSAKYTAKTPEQSQLPLNEPWVEDAANKAFPSDTVQAHINTVIDSIFAWLNGKTEKPEFRIDLTENKQVLAREIGNYASSRLASLPLCGRGDIPDPDQINFFTIKCRPPGVNPTAVGSNIEEEVTLNEGFLENPVISSENLVLPDNSQASTANLEGLRQLYQNKSLLLIGLPLLTIIVAALGVWLAADKTMALRRLARALLLSGLGLLIFTAIFFIISNLVTNAAPEDELLTQELVAPVFRDLSRKAQSIYLAFGIIAIALSAAVIFARKRLQPKTVQSSKEPQH